MTTALAVHRPQALLPTEDEAGRMWKLAQRVASTEMVPRTYRGKPEAVLAVALAGRELGLAPMEALRSFDVIEGKPSPSAQLQHTLALRAGHDIAVVQTTAEKAVVRCRRAEWPADRHVDIEFTIEDAKAAGLVGKANWKSYTRAMLRNRAVSEAVRAVCPDVMMGATYSAEELGAADTGADGRVDDGAWVDQVELDDDTDEAIIEDAVIVDDETEPDETDEPDSDVVDAEVIDDEPSQPAVGKATNPREATTQRALEFGREVAKYPDEFAQWLHSDGQFVTARTYAIKSDENLGKACARLKELHDHWSSQQDAPTTPEDRTW